MKAQIRKDLRDAKIWIPAIDMDTGHEMNLNGDTIYQSEQPEILENTFYNTLLKVKTCTYAVQSIDMDFIQEKKCQE